MQGPLAAQFVGRLTEHVPEHKHCDTEFMSRRTKDESGQTQVGTGVSPNAPAHFRFSQRPLRLGMFEPARRQSV